MAALLTKMSIRCMVLTIGGGMKILVVDDEAPELALEDIARKFGVTIQLARSEREAMGLLLASEVAELQLILMDGYLEPNRDKPRDTEELVRWIRRKGYQGPMIAISSDRIVSQKLVAAGCTELWHKLDSIPKLKEWIREHTEKEKTV
jgi:CheY-like chemotaxis protein